MNHRQNHPVERIYRNRYVPYFLAFMVIAGIILNFLMLPAMERQTTINQHAVNVVTVMFRIAFPMNIVMFIAVLLIRAAYHRNPICPTCGIDAVDCKIKRDTILPHWQWAE